MKIGSWQGTTEQAVEQLKGYGLSIAQLAQELETTKAPERRHELLEGIDWDAEQAMAFSRALWAEAAK